MEEMAELEDLLAGDPEMAGLAALVDDLLLPQLDECEKKLEPIEKNLKHVEGHMQPLKGIACFFINFKRACSNLFRLFIKNFLRVWYQKESHNFCL